MFYFDWTALTVFVFFATGWLGLLLAAHLGWLMALSKRLAPYRLRPLLLIAAALTPLVSFYALLVTDRWREPGPWPARWRWFLPLASLAMLALAAADYESHYAPEYRSFSGWLEQIGVLFLWFLPTAAITHMAAMVFGATRQLPPFSRSQLVSAGILLAMTVIL